MTYISGGVFRERPVKSRCLVLQLTISTKVLPPIRGLLL